MACSSTRGTHTPTRTLNARAHTHAPSAGPINLATSLNQRSQRTNPRSPYALGWIGLDVGKGWGFALLPKACCSLLRPGREDIRAAHRSPTGSPERMSSARSRSARRRPPACLAAASADTSSAAMCATWGSGSDTHRDWRICTRSAVFCTLAASTRLNVQPQPLSRPAGERTAAAVTLPAF
jgi:hypothetical protein